MKKAGLLFFDNEFDSHLNYIKEVEDLDLCSDLSSMDLCFSDTEISGAFSNFLEKTENVICFDSALKGKEVLVSCIKAGKNIYLHNWQLFGEEFFKEIIKLSKEADVYIHLDRSLQTWLYKSHIAIKENAPEIVEINRQINRESCFHSFEKIIEAELLCLNQAIGNKLKRGESVCIRDCSGDIKTFKTILHFSDQLIVDFSIDFVEESSTQIRCRYSGARVEFDQNLRVELDQVKRQVELSEFKEGYAKYYKEQFLHFIKAQDMLIPPDGELIETLHFYESLKKVRLKNLG